MLFYLKENSSNLLDSICFSVKWGKNTLLHWDYSEEYIALVGNPWKKGPKCEKYYSTS